jgi:hypothetical protein
MENPRVRHMEIKIKYINKLIVLAHQETLAELDACAVQHFVEAKQEIQSIIDCIEFSENNDLFTTKTE